MATGRPPIPKLWQIVGHQGTGQKHFLFAEILSMHASDPRPNNDHQTNFDLWQSSSFDYCCQQLDTRREKGQWLGTGSVENIFIFHSNSMLIYLHNKPHFLPGLRLAQASFIKEPGTVVPFLFLFIFPCSGRWSTGVLCGALSTHIGFIIFIVQVLDTPFYPGFISLQPTRAAH